MPTQPFAYRPLFLLEADNFFLLEIKALEVKSEDPAEVYFWLHYDRARRTLQKLEFVSMTDQGEQQERVFRQGQLQFGPQAGTYTAAGAAPLALRRQPAGPLPAELDEAIQRYFIGG